MGKKLLIFIGEGIGNIIQAIPSVIAIHSLGYQVDVVVRSNYVGTKDILQIPEINNVYNTYIQRIPEPQSYSKIVLTMFGHIEHYKKDRCEQCIALQSEPDYLHTSPELFEAIAHYLVKKQAPVITIEQGLALMRHPNN